MKFPTRADIDEMKARGYDRSTIEAAEIQHERLQPAQEVERLIEAAFAGVTLGNGVGLTEAIGLDDYADAETCAEDRAKDEKDDWHRIPAKSIRECYGSLSLFDAEGMRFHLPAYLLAELKDEYGFGIDFCLTHLSEHGLSRFALFSGAQRNAVRAFLLLLSEDPDFKFGRAEILCALDTYWTDESTQST